MKRITIALACLFALLGTPNEVQAAPNDIEDLFRGGGVVFDHPPLLSGGPAADTIFINSSGQQSWQQLADNILLDSPAVIRQVRWWGFYGANFGGIHEPPVGETMRIRVYGDATPSGLPDGENIIFEESFLNPQRAATGRTIGIGGLPDEFVYEVDLTSPLALSATTTYWIEIVQVGDVDSLFRWQYAWVDMDGMAFRHISLPDWQSDTPDLAFQLSTVPEPATFTFIVFGGVCLRKRGRKEDAGG